MIFLNDYSMKFDQKTEEILASLEAESDENWNISRETAEYLLNLCKERGLSRVLEIGTSTGYSAIWFALSGCYVVTVESHRERFEKASANFERAELLDRILQVKGHAPEVLDAIKGDFDLIFLDATKKEYVRYYAALKGRLRKGGVLVADNVSSHQEALRPFLEAIQNDADFVTERVEIGTGLLVATKVS